MVERIWVRRNKRVERLIKLIYDLAQFRNLILIFIHRYHEKTGKWIVSASILYTLLADRISIKTKNNRRKIEKLKEIESSLDEELADLLNKARVQKVKVDNNYLVQQVLRRIEKDFRSYFKLMKEYRRNPGKFAGKPNPPKPRKLRSLRHFTVG